MSGPDETGPAVWRDWGREAPPEALPEFRRKMRRALRERDQDDTSDFELEVRGETYLIDGLILRRVDRCQQSD